MWQVFSEQGVLDFGFLLTGIFVRLMRMTN